VAGGALLPGAGRLRSPTWPRPDPDRRCRPEQRGRRLEHGHSRRRRPHPARTRYRSRSWSPSSIPAAPGHEGRSAPDPDPALLISSVTRVQSGAGRPALASLSAASPRRVVLPPVRPSVGRRARCVPGSGGCGGCRGRGAAWCGVRLAGRRGYRGRIPNQTDRRCRGSCRQATHVPSHRAGLGAEGMVDLVELARKVGRGPRSTPAGNRRRSRRGYCVLAAMSCASSLSASARTATPPNADRRISAAANPATAARPRHNQGRPSDGSGRKARPRKRHHCRCVCNALPRLDGAADRGGHSSCGARFTGIGAGPYGSGRQPMSHRTKSKTTNSLSSRSCSCRSWNTLKMSEQASSVVTNHSKGWQAHAHNFWIL
jgi:hypothetical protein